MKKLNLKMAEMDEKERLEANCVCVMGSGVLLLGPSSSGKSDLTLRLLHAQSVFLKEACALVCDDQTFLWSENGELYGAPPPQLAGRLEVRGVGVLSFEHLEKVKITLAVELTDQENIERIPILGSENITLADVQIPKVQLYPFEASAPQKIFSLIMALEQNFLSNDI